MAAEVYVDLVHENGELIRISCPSKFEDDLHETLKHAMKRKDTWSPMQFDGCSAEYLGISLEHVNMANIIGEI